MFNFLLLKVDVSGERDQSQAAVAGVLVLGHVFLVLAIITEVVDICFASGRKRVVEEAASCESLPGPSAESDKAPALASAPGLSWKSFMRQVSASAEPGPTRGVGGAGGSAVGRRKRWACPLFRPFPDRQCMR
ncbi:unnamed protein product, partial [Ectocarpus sp. 8 AP-2014]